MVPGQVLLSPVLVTQHATHGWHAVTLRSSPLGHVAPMAIAHAQRDAAYRGGVPPNGFPIKTRGSINIIAARE